MTKEIPFIHDAYTDYAIEKYDLQIGGGIL